MILINCRQNIKNICISLGVFLLFGGYNSGLNSTTGRIMMYLGLFVLLMGILRGMCRHVTLSINKKKCTFVCLIVLLSMGLGLQKDLTLSQKATPIVSFIIMILFYMYGYHLIDSLEKIRLFGYILLITFVFSMIVSPALGIEIIMRPTEGLSYALTAGLGHKNSSSICMLAAFMAIATYYKLAHKKKIDFIACSLLVIFIIAGASRSAWLLMLIFVVLLNQDILKRIKTESRFIFYAFLIGIFLLCVYIFISMLLLESQSYGVRLIGLYSYLFQYGDDCNVMLLGHGDILYNDAYGDDYDHRIWVLLGGMGTFEIAYLDILAKSGILGIIAYLYIYFYPIFIGMRTKFSLLKTLLVSFSIIALVSGMVDIFISQIISPYTVLTLCSLSYAIYKHEQYEKKIKICAGEKN